MYLGLMVKKPAAALPTAVARAAMGAAYRAAVAMAASIPVERSIPARGSCSIGRMPGGLELGGGLLGMVSMWPLGSCSIGRMPGGLALGGGLIGMVSMWPRGSCS